jgi:hypothetical protein
LTKPQAARRAPSLASFGDRGRTKLERPANGLRRGQGGPVRSKRSRLLVGWMRLVRNDPSGEHAALLAPPLVDLIGPSPKPRISRELGYRMVATSKRAAHPPCAPTVIGGHRCSEEDRAYVRYGQDKPETRQVLGGRAIPTRPRRQWRQTRSVGFRADDGATPSNGWESYP